MSRKPFHGINRHATLTSRHFCELRAGRRRECFFVRALQVEVFGSSWAASPPSHASTGSSLRRWQCRLDGIRLHWKGIPFPEAFGHRIRRFTQLGNKNKLDIVLVLVLLVDPCGQNNVASSTVTAVQTETRRSVHANTVSKPTALIHEIPFSRLDSAGE